MPGVRPSLDGVDIFGGGWEQGASSYCALAPVGPHLGG
jgi:hypothetical protein